MSVLDIDAGNTRLKWRQTADGRVIASGALINQAAELLVDQLAESVAGIVSNCRLTSVRAPEFIRALTNAVERRFQVGVRVPRPVSGTGGLLIKHVEPTRLGDDRWLAMLGAVRLYPGCAVMVVDCGTAMTLDVVDERGQFCGGMICPGLKAMLKSMSDSADRLMLPSQPDWQRGLTYKSLQAVQNGVLSMAASLIEKEVERFRKPIKVLLCGGDARVLAESLDIPVHYQAELVFDGLDVALPIEEDK